MTEKLGEIQGNWNSVRVSKEPLSEFGLPGFNHVGIRDTCALSLHPLHLIYLCILKTIRKRKILVFDTRQEAVFYC